MYSTKILELFKNPINAGGLQGANGVGKYIDSVCGDSIKIYLKIDENQSITSARFKAIGCVGTIVASSAVCSCLLDCSLEEALKIDENRIYDITGEFPKDKKYAIEFALKAVKNAIDNYYVHIEKEQKKAKNDLPKNEYKNVISKQENQVVSPEIKERRNVSAAKAAFDALFDL